VSDISAFAARKQLQVAYDAHENGPDTTFKTNESLVNSEERPLFNSASILGSGIATQIFEGGVGQELDQSSEDDGVEGGSISDHHEEDDGFVETASKYVISHCNLIL
jgi:hypothetical protein